MKGYMLSPKASASFKKFHTKKNQKAEVIDNFMMNAILDNEAVEVPLRELDEVGLMIFLSDYEKKGWVKLYLPENEEEVKWLQNTAKQKGMEIKF